MSSEFNNIEFVKLPDGRYAAIVDTSVVSGETRMGHISHAKTGGAGAQLEPGLYFSVNVWRRREKNVERKLTAVRDVKLG